MKSQSKTKPSPVPEIPDDFVERMTDSSFRVIDEKALNHILLVREPRRSRDHEDMPSYTDNLKDDMVRRMDMSFKATFNQNASVYHPTSLEQDYKIGDILHEAGFISVTPIREVAQDLSIGTVIGQFWGKKCRNQVGRPTVFEIELPDGTHCAAGEQRLSELVLERDMIIQVDAFEIIEGAGCYRAHAL